MTNFTRYNRSRQSPPEPWREWIEATVNLAVREANEEASAESVHRLFERLGMDEDEIRELRADLLYLRKMRLGGEFIRKHVLVSIITAAVGGVLWLLWYGFRHLLK